MKISELFKQKRTVVSFEIFPPKQDTDFDSVLHAADELSALRPDYMSVTYGAGGGTSRNTVAIARHLQQDNGVTALAHLTCASSTREEVSGIVDALGASGIENILALRGDRAPGKEGCFNYASELIEEIRRHGDFCIGGACYPEGHIECGNKETDIDHLKAKVESGCDFLITQMFFDNNVLYNFLYRLASKGIGVPVVAGIMPITSAASIKRVTSLCGAVLPPKHRAILDRFGDNPAALRQASIAYAVEQIVDLAANGVRGIHIYTMNKPDIAQSIMHSVSEILR